MSEIREAYDRYGDIICMPHPVSRKHKPMGRVDRAAQFSPFAALTGYDEAIDEAARYTDERPVLSEEERLEINRRLSRIQSECASRPVVMIRYFRPDALKAGGAVITVTEAVKKIKIDEARLILENGSELLFDDLLSIEGSLFDETEDMATEGS